MSRVYVPNPVLLDPSIETRQTDHDLTDPNNIGTFDFSTLCYDGFFTSRNRLRLSCPPPRNLTKFIVDDDNRVFGHETTELVIDNQDRNTNFDITFREDLGKIKGPIPIKVGDQTQKISFNPVDRSTFKNRRVLLTISKNNDLRWIRDWLWYHTTFHRINAVLLYDNNSDRYSVQDIADLIASVPGIKAFKVVTWNFPFGLQHKNEEFWDSDFCQYGMFEHARHMFLSDAETVTNLDIDELLYSETGQDIHKLVKQSRKGFLHYSGQWIDGVTDSGEIPDDASFAVYRYRHRDSKPSPKKWTASPRRNQQQQWRTHSAGSGKASHVFTDQFEFKHFRNITMQWRNRQRVHATPTDQHEIDPIAKYWEHDHKNSRVRRSMLRLRDWLTRGFSPR